MIILSASLLFPDRIKNLGLSGRNTNIITVTRAGILLSSMNKFQECRSKGTKIKSQYYYYFYNLPIISVIETWNLNGSTIKAIIGRTITAIPLAIPLINCTLDLYEVE